MKNRWSDADERAFVATLPAGTSAELAQRTYSARLLGSDPALVLHGGGNTSVKTTHPDIFGESRTALFMKASGCNLGTIGVDGHVAVRLEPLRGLLRLEALEDLEMRNQVRLRLFDSTAPDPSIETLVHAAVPGRFVDHTHADAVLALGNRPGGVARLRDALGETVLLLPYAVPGLELAKAVSSSLARADETPSADGTRSRDGAMVWLHHGVVTWAPTAHESYTAMIELVGRAEAALTRVSIATAGSVDAADDASAVGGTGPEATAAPLREHFVPILRGVLSRRLADTLPGARVVVHTLDDPLTIALLGDPDIARKLVSAPLTADHLVRTKPLPLLFRGLSEATPEDDAALRESVAEAVARYSADYESYFDRERRAAGTTVEPFDPLPRVVLVPGLGALCCGPSEEAARIAKDITAQTLAAKSTIFADGDDYEGLSDEHLFAMEYRHEQRFKLGDARRPLEGRTALVTGAAGAIGSAICQRLLAQGACVAATDLEGEPLRGLGDELRSRHGGRALAVALDVTDGDSVSAGFSRVVREWGGVDLIVLNAGLAHVAPLAELGIERFRQLQRVNTDGALLLLAEAARHFELQAAGGDVVLISTKNVPAPGARFGAYSATKAAAHQLARVASLELAPLDVRVNMLMPDAVFSHGERPSGLWQEVGPDRMKARGLDEDGLESYYRERNLLKTGITADDVASGVLFFATRQTPTTGAALPIDGGLPEATPR